MVHSDIKVGTSGYSFNDWIGSFYPLDIKKGKMLDYYSQYFNSVEINSTYYRIPHRAIFYHLDKKTPDNFEFIVKLHSSTTHSSRRDVQAIKSIIESVSPLIDAGKLFGLLAQFPWSFKMTLKNLEYIDKIRKYCEGIPLFVEFRHKSWDKEEVYSFFREEGIGYCCVDEPALEGLLEPQSIATTGTGYVRFHGRNKLTWWDSSKGDRYDYLYNENELNEWLERLRALRQKTTKTYIFFNNCHQGHAVKNALMFIEKLSKLQSLSISSPESQ